MDGSSPVVPKPSHNVRIERAVSTVKNTKKKSPVVATPGLFQAERTNHEP